MLKTHENRNFQGRKTDSDFYTTALMEYLQSINHFKIDRIAPLNEDTEGIDAWVQYPLASKIVPIQFKLREMSLGRIDCPVAMHQPFMGVDIPESRSNNRGRDYRGLKNKSSKFYYWATIDCFESNYIYSDINIITSSKLWSLVNNLEEEFINFNDEEDNSPPYRPKKWFTSQNINKIDNVPTKLMFRDSNGSEIWWKKTSHEKGKLLGYIPNKFKMKTVKVDSKKSLLLNEEFKKFKNGV
jgi:hypothetical protein